MDLASRIRDIPNFPKPGIIFKDITPLLADPIAFRQAIDELAAALQTRGATKIVGAEARGFIFAASVAYKLGLGFIPVRKPGKLPYRTTSVTYELEYGTDTLCMHEDAIQPGEKVLIIDDVLATGGTVHGILQLVEKAGGKVVGIGFLIELDFLQGRKKLGNLPIVSLIHVAGE